MASCFVKPRPPDFEEGWSKGRWGPVAWRYIHVLAIRYPARPTRQDRCSALGALIECVQRLPCFECRAHADAYLRAAPPGLESSAQFQAWAWRFHNSVNARLGKPHFSAAEYVARYADEIERAKNLRCL